MFKCNICEKEYLNSSNLKKQIKTDETHELTEKKVSEKKIEMIPDLSKTLSKLSKQLTCSEMNVFMPFINMLYRDLENNSYNEQ